VRRFLTVALIASVLLTTNAFSADAKKSKHHAKGAQQSQQQHAQHAQHVAPTHPSKNANHSATHNKKKGHAHKPAHVQV
jgi:outer membrane biogenesis lipoprotein LolB